MKPLNLDNRPCSPISSNCVIWQGPNISCINLCTGDTVSDVVAKLGTELCTIMDQLNVTNYDLSCLDLTSCGPSDFKGLIELLITKVCEANGVPISNNKSVFTCPDCVVSVAPCFVQGTTTTMQLVDYVNTVANRICSILDQIAAINNELEIINNTLSDLQTQIDNIPPYTLPSISGGCLFPSGTYQLDQILDTLVNDIKLGYCSLLNATGEPGSILAAVASQCVAPSDESFANPGNNMGTAYVGSWVNSPVSIADAITNLWLSICDVRNYIGNSLPVVNVTGSTWVNVTSSTVGNTTTFNVSEVQKPGLSVSSSPPANLNKTTPALSTGTLCFGDIQVMSTIEYNDFGAAYDPSTGIFTVPATGVYDISFFTHFTRDADNGWYDAAVPGMFVSGIVSPVGCSYYCINSSSPVVPMKHCSINGSIVRSLNAGVQICLKVINLTNFNYRSFVGDVSRLTIQRIK